MSTPAIIIAGTGAVSPAGWGVTALVEAAARATPLPVTTLERPGWDTPLTVRKVPPPTARPAFLAHPRLRRSSPISHFTAAAALEALGHEDAPAPTPRDALGVVFCTMAGPMNYSRRFFAEARRDPATASPLLFPETVFNAPASHLAAMLGVTGPVYTLMGDDSVFLQGLAMAAHWLLEQRVTACLVIGAEEVDWLPADAFRLFLRGHILSEGAGALLLRAGHPAEGPRVEAVSDCFSYFPPRGNQGALAALRRQLQGADAPHALLCDSRQGLPRRDRAETTAWADWPGARCSPRQWLGHALNAATAWQTVLAAAALAQGRHARAIVCAAGCNHQALGAVVRSPQD